MNVFITITRPEKAKRSFNVKLLFEMIASYSFHHLFGKFHKDVCTYSCKVTPLWFENRRGSENRERDREGTSESYLYSFMLLETLELRDALLSFEQLYHFHRLLYTRERKTRVLYISRL